MSVVKQNCEMHLKASSYELLRYEGLRAMSKEVLGIGYWEEVADGMS
jgi:hypothetical protein